MLGGGTGPPDHQPPGHVDLVFGRGTGPGGRAGNGADRHESSIALQRRMGAAEGGGEAWCGRRAALRRSGLGRW